MIIQGTGPTLPGRPAAPEASTVEEPLLLVEDTFSPCTPRIGGYGEGESSALSTPQGGGYRSPLL